jgi:Sulfotransferase family
MGAGDDLIRIEDLRAPVLDEVQRLALDYGQSRVVEMTVDSVLRAARQRAGLDDFGPEDFVDRLRMWLDEVNADGNRTGLGRAMTFSLCVRYATARLRLRDFSSRHPEVHDIDIAEPIIVIGLPRSGTTHLLNLVSADTGLRSLPLWESYEPVPAQDEPATHEESDARYRRCAREWETMQSVLPYQAAMHPMNPDHINEEIELQGPDFASYILEWVARVPGWRDHYLATDQTPHYAYMRNVLQALQFQGGPNRWVLKSPQHLEQIGPLMRTFPDATVVVTHRDPVSVIQSAATMMAYAARLQYRHIDVDFILEYWADRVERLLRSSVRDRHLLPAERTVDVLYHEFMADDMGTVERIYGAAGRPLTTDTRAAMARYIADHPRGRHGQVAYDLRADFGVEPDALRERFAFYFEMFPVQPEVR